MSSSPKRGFEVHCTRTRTRAVDTVEFRTLAHPGYSCEGIEAYRNVPQQVVAAGGRYWTSMDEQHLINVRLALILVDVSGRLRTSLDGSPGRIRTSDQSVNSRTLYH